MGERQCLGQVPGKRRDGHYLTNQLAEALCQFSKHLWHMAGGRTKTYPKQAAQVLSGS
ncbi:hypothetical protein [Terribacillus sp. 7520-G]|uniref:hypothetical protein n=1 Tax=unclassified Terribacillus TaxID=2636508 RepID=UPI0013042254|nr:hypothetical protein [Terribacillus sp. 7520-G]